MRISDWSSDVCYSDLLAEARIVHHAGQENLVIGLHAAFPDHADLDFVASAVRLVNLIDGGAVALSILDASHDKVGKAHLAGGDLADNVAAAFIELEATDLHDFILSLSCGSFLFPGQVRHSSVW